MARISVDLVAPSPLEEGPRAFPLPYFVVAMQRPVDKYLFDHPEIWEQNNQPRFDREPAFLAEVFRRYGSVERVLDVGCGTGGHLDRLSRLGLTGTGVDLNERMLDYARNAHPHLRFHVADMRALPFDDEFDAVVCLCTTFSYNTTNEDVVTALGCFHRALRPGGLVVIDVFNPIRFIQTRGYLEEIEQVWESFDLRCVTAHDVDEARQVQIATQSVFRIDDRQLVQSDVTEFRLFFPQELRYFLETNAFRFLCFYGDFDVESTSLDGTRLIAVAQKS
jgi:SAM-dependent methyltransferase